MAYVGVRKPFVAPFAQTAGKYLTPIAFGKATTFEETPNVAEATLYGDDALAESERGITSAALSLGTTHIPDEAIEPMFGHQTTEGEQVSNIDDAAGYCGFAVIGVKKVNGVRSYEARVYPKTQWSEPGTNLTTKGESTEFQTPSAEGTALPNDDGVWRFIESFDTEAAAVAYINTKFPTT